MDADYEILHKQETALCADAEALLTTALQELAELPKKTATEGKAVLKLVQTTMAQLRSRMRELEQLAEEQDTCVSA